MVMTVNMSPSTVTTEDMQVHSLALKSLVAPPFCTAGPLPLSQSMSAIGGADGGGRPTSILMHLSQSKLDRSRSNNNVVATHLLHKQILEDAHQLAQPQSFPPSVRCVPPLETPERSSSLRSLDPQTLCRLELLNIQVGALRKSLERSRAKEGGIKDRIERQKERLEKVRCQRNSKIESLRSQVVEVETAFRKQHTRKTILCRNTVGALNKLKMGFSDPPEDKEELEMESEWEVNVQLAAMEQMRKDLSEQRFVIQTARGIYKKRFGHSICDCTLATQAAERILVLGEKSFHPVVVSGEWKIKDNVCQRENSVRYLKGQLDKSVVAIKEEENMIERQKRQLNRSLVDAMKEGKLTPMVHKRLEDLNRVMKKLNWDKEVELRKAVSGIGACRRREIAMEQTLQITKRKALSLGDKSKLSCQHFARVAIRPPMDCSHVTIDQGCWRRHKFIVSKPKVQFSPAAC